MVEPPKPRLITFRSGKSAAADVHLRMLEEPTKSTAPCGGACLASAASNASISFSKGGPAGREAGDAGAAAGAARQTEEGVREVATRKSSRAGERCFKMAPGDGDGNTPSRLADRLRLRSR